MTSQCQLSLTYFYLSQVHPAVTDSSLHLGAVLAASANVPVAIAAFAAPRQPPLSGVCASAAVMTAPSAGLAASSDHMLTAGTVFSGLLSKSASGLQQGQPLAAKAAPRMLYRVDWLASQVLPAGKDSKPRRPHHWTLRGKENFLAVQQRHCSPAAAGLADLQVLQQASTLQASDISLVTRGLQLGDVMPAPLSHDTTVHAAAAVALAKVAASEQPELRLAVTDASALDAMASTASITSDAFGLVTNSRLALEPKLVANELMPAKEDAPLCRMGMLGASCIVSGGLGGGIINAEHCLAGYNLL